MALVLGARGLLGSRPRALEGSRAKVKTRQSRCDQRRTGRCKLRVPEKSRVVEPVETTPIGWSSPSRPRFPGGRARRDHGPGARSAGAELLETGLQERYPVGVAVQVQVPTAEDREQ